LRTLPNASLISGIVFSLQHQVFGPPSSAIDGSSRCELDWLDLTLVRAPSQCMPRSSIRSWSLLRPYGNFFFAPSPNFPPTILFCITHTFTARHIPAVVSACAGHPVRSRLPLRSMPFPPSHLLLRRPLRQPDSSRYLFLSLRHGIYFVMCFYSSVYLLVRSCSVQMDSGG
jgi:hypothetical protein